MDIGWLKRVISYYTLEFSGFFHVWKLCMKVNKKGTLWMFFILPSLGHQKRDESMAVLEQSILQIVFSWGWGVEKKCSLALQWGDYWMEFGFFWLRVAFWEFFCILRICCSCYVMAHACVFRASQFCLEGGRDVG